jgi:hypothetical protein
VTVFHLHGDDAGETHLRTVELPERDTDAGRVRNIGDIEVTTAGLGGFVGRKPDVGMHNAPRRQLLIVLDGALEVVTSVEEQQVLRPGDVLFADDVGTKGHISRDVGADPLSIMAIGVAEGWTLPDQP